MRQRRWWTFVVVDGDEDGAVVGEEFAQELQARAESIMQPICRGG